MASVSSAWAIFGLPTMLAQVSSPTAFSRSPMSGRRWHMPVHHIHHSSWKARSGALASDDTIGYSPQSDAVFVSLSMARFEGLLMLFVDRLTAILWLTFSLAMIGVFGKWGARLQNALGTFKFGILAGIALLGLLSLVGVPRFVIRPAYKTPHNFASWDALWSGSRSDPNSLVLTRGRSFIGYSNANYALPEVKDPVRTIKRAAPLAI
ncbi:hypothetical protein C8R44DRAFT_876555 [Mycena epipterygia]|nr:hypothetical protein C8R44DRAFT_876555 [Mycena epipterygia]